MRNGAGEPERSDLARIVVFLAGGLFVILGIFVALRPGYLVGFTSSQLGLPSGAIPPQRFSCGTPLFDAPWKAIPLRPGAEGPVVTPVYSPRTAYCSQVLVRGRAAGTSLAFVGGSAWLLALLAPRLVTCSRAACRTFALGLLAAVVVVPTMLLGFSRYDYEAAWEGFYGFTVLSMLLGLLAGWSGAAVVLRSRLDSLAMSGLALGLTAFFVGVCALAGVFGPVPLSGGG